MEVGASRGIHRASQRAGRRAGRRARRRARRAARRPVPGRGRRRARPGRRALARPPAGGPPRRLAGPGRRGRAPTSSSPSPAGWSATRWPPPPASTPPPTRGGPSGWPGRCSAWSTPTSTSRGSTCWPATSAARARADGRHGRGQGRRRFAAVRHLADLFDRYAVHRPAMVRAWADGLARRHDRHGDGDGPALPDDAAWQAELWRRLRDVIAARRARPSALAAGCAALIADPAVVDLPDRFFLFGLTRLPASYLDVLGALAVHRDVHLLALHPSPELWRPSPPTRRSTPTPPRSSSTTRCCGPGAATAARCSWCWPARLAGAGAVRRPPPPARRAAADLAARPPAARHPPRPGAARRRRGADAAAVLPVLSADDRSVQVHACHGRARQAEVVRDAITHLLADDPTLEPRDVVVMCPDIDEFAPLLRAAFERRPRRATSSRSVPDRRPGGRRRSAVDPVPPGRPLAAPDQPGARRRRRAARPGRRPPHRLAGAGLRRARAGARPLRLRRRRPRAPGPLDRATPAPAGASTPTTAPPTTSRRSSTGTWDAGLRRLLLGVAMAEEDERLVGGVLPLDDVDSGDIDLAGRFAELVGRLGAAVASLRGPQPVGGLDASHRRRRRPAARHPGRATPGSASSSTASCARWAASPATRPTPTAGRRGGADRPTLRLAEIRDLLADRLRGQPTRAAFRTGDLTMCTLVPMRSVPHRVVCLVGLDDGAFPRGGAPDGDDLLVAPDVRQLGDHDRRAEDRQLLLDAVLAAGDALVITYAGRDPSHQRGPAAGGAGQRAARRARRRHRRRRRRRLAPHGPRPRRPRPPAPAGRPPLLRARRARPGRPWGFDPALLAGAAAAGRGQRRHRRRRLPPRAAAAARRGGHRPRRPGPLRPAPGRGLPAPAPRPQPQGLGRPARWTPHHRARRARPVGRRRPPARGPCSPGATPTRSARPSGPGACCRRAGSARRALAKARDKAVAIAEAARQVADGRRTSLEVDVLLPDGRQVVGTVPDVVGDVIRPATFSRLGPKRLAAGWVRLLAATATHPDRALSCTLVGSGGKNPAAVTFGPLADSPDARRRRALELLAAIVDLRDRGLREPLPLFTATSHRYADQVRSDNPDALESAAGYWTSSFDWDKEDRDAEHVLVLGGQVPFADLPAEPPAAGEDGTGWAMGERTRFGRLARRLWDPILDAAAAGASPSRTRGDERTRPAPAPSPPPTGRSPSRSPSRCPRASPCSRPAPAPARPTPWRRSWSPRWPRAARSTSSWSSPSPARPPAPCASASGSASARSPAASTRGRRAGAADDELVEHLRRGSEAEVAARRSRLEHALSDFDAATIATTHGFCQQVLASLGVVGDAERDLDLVEDIADLVDDAVDDLFVRRFHGGTDVPLFDRAAARAIAAAVVQNPDAEIAGVDGNDTDLLRQRFATTLRDRIAEQKRRGRLLTYDDLLVRLADQHRRRRPRAARGRAPAPPLLDGHRRRVPGHRHRPVATSCRRRSARRPAGSCWSAIRSRRSTPSGAATCTPTSTPPRAPAPGTLDVSWRSDQPLLDALDAVLDGAAARRRPHRPPPAPGPARRRATGSGRPRRRRRRSPCGSSSATTADGRHHPAGQVQKDPARALRRRRPRRRGRPPPHRSAPRWSSATATARPGPSGRLTPGDVAVLVRRHKDAETVRDALRAVGVPAVVHGNDDVLATDAAGALARPAAGARAAGLAPLRARSVALGPFFGWDAAPAGHGHRRRLGPPRRPPPRLGRRGAGPRGRRPAGPPRPLDDLSARLLGPGRRRAAAERPAPRRRAARPEPARPPHLDRRAGRAGSPRSAPASAPSGRRRLESDADAVAIHTIHGAKGLEFPVVLLPSLWDGPWTPDDALPVFHDADGAASAASASAARAGCAATRSAIAQAERDDEELRLLYVALDPGPAPGGRCGGPPPPTRARRPSPGSCSVATPATGAVVDRLGRSPDEATIRDALLALPAAAAGAIAVVDADRRAGGQLPPRRPGRRRARPAPVRAHLRPALDPHLLQRAHPGRARRGARAGPPRRRRDRRRHRPRRRRRGGGRRPGRHRRRRQGRRARARRRHRRPRRARPRRSAGRLPARSATCPAAPGSARWSTTCSSTPTSPPPTWSPSVAARRRPGRRRPPRRGPGRRARRRPGRRHRDPARSHRRRPPPARRRPRATASTSCPSTCRWPAATPPTGASLTMGAIADVFATLPGRRPAGRLPRAPARPAARPPRSAGFLTGSIDLVARVGDRHVVVDYKTNLLAPIGDRPRAWHYRPDGLAEAMAAAPLPAAGRALRRGPAPLPALAPGRLRPRPPPRRRRLPVPAGHDRSRRPRRRRPARAACSPGSRRRRSSWPCPTCSTGGRA